MAYYLHHVPGRLRVKTPFIKGSEERALEVQNFLQRLGGIESISANTVTGSLTIYYNPAEIGPEILTKALMAGGTEEQNKNLASALNGFKALGAMMAAQEPAAGELLNAIEITAGQDFVRLYISVSEEAMDKLGKAAQAKVGDMIKFNTEKPAEEKPAEKPEVKK
jgi:hypothetical protein